jgi:MFS family permease
VAHAFVTPAQQAVVPSLVAPERLSTAVGLVTVSMQVAFFLGAVLNGAAIRLLGIGGAFAVMALLCLASSLAMSRVPVPGADRDEDDPQGGPLGLVAEARAGLAFVAGTEPLRSLVLAGVVIGLLWGVIQINLPVVAKESMGRTALAASVLVGAFTPGSLLSSLWVATRRELARPGLLFALALGVGLGPGAIVLGLSESYGLTLCTMAVWGLFGGVAMTTQRTIVQSRTPARMMGRVMGIWTLAMVGAFPLAAGISAALAPRLGAGGTMVAAALATALAAPALVFRRAVREA